MEELIYLFPSDTFSRDEAHDWVYQDRYAEKLLSFISVGKVGVYSASELCKACNDKDIFDVWEHWFVTKTV